MVGAYEREAIRPHVLGRFAEMLAAVESHPAMLFYLDNVQSMGAEQPRSTSRKSWRAISSPTSRRPRSSPSSRKRSRTPTAI